MSTFSALPRCAATAADSDEKVEASRRVMDQQKLSHPEGDSIQDLSALCHAADPE
jgi:hypothetical protein